jgi:hypothetical protein
MMLVSVKSFTKGIIDNITDIRGINTTEPTKNIVVRFLVKAKGTYDTLADELQDVGAFASDFNNKMSIPSLEILIDSQLVALLEQKITRPYC